MTEATIDRHRGDCRKCEGTGELLSYTYDDRSRIDGEEGHDCGECEGTGKLYGEILPGPWKVEHPKPSESWVVGVQEDGTLGLIAACETVAEAHAIAALPELVKAAKDALWALDLADQDKVDGGTITRALRSAIKRAGG